MEQKPRGFEVSRESSHAGLRERIQSLAKSELELRKEAGRLASALRSPGVRGRWGEMQLRGVVELSVMAGHCDFTEQVPTEGGSRKIAFRHDPSICPAGAVW